MNWLFVHAGLSSGNSPWYLFPSGAFSYLAVLSFFAGLWAFLRRHNCEVHKCWRLARHTTAAGHRVCRFHHPDDHLTAAHVAAAHEAAKAAPYNPFAPAMERLKRKDDQ